MLPCSAADFAEALSVMNAKERKKMTRRQQRAAFQTSTATEDTAQDAVTRSAMEFPASKMKGETNYDYDVRVYDMQLKMPQMIAAVVAQSIRDKDHAPVKEGELNYLARLVDEILLPKAMKKLETGLLEMRRQREAGSAVKGASMDVEFEIHYEDGEGKGADTRLAGIPSQDGLQDGSVSAVKSPPDGTKLGDIDKTNSLTDEEPNELWETALAQSRITGGEEAEIQQRTVKIYRGLKKKLKSQQKQQLLAA